MTRSSRGDPPRSPGESVDQGRQSGRSERLEHVAVVLAGPEIGAAVGRVADLLHDAIADDLATVNVVLAVGVTDDVQVAIGDAVHLDPVATLDVLVAVGDARIRASKI